MKGQDDTDNSRIGRPEQYSGSRTGPQPVEILRELRQRVVEEFVALSGLGPVGSQRIISTMVVALLVASTLGAGLSAGAAAELGTPAAAQQDGVTAQEALNERRQAQKRLQELRRLDRQPMTSVDPSTIRAVRNRLRNGNLSYDRANYAEAAEHWKIAQEQANAVLASEYNAGSSRYLNATTAYLNSREAAGYSSPAMARFSGQVRELRNRDPDSLAGQRQRYRDARALHANVESTLPTMTAVAIAQRLTPLWVAGVVSIGTILVIGGCAAYAGYSLGRSRSSGTGPTGPDPDPEPTTSRLRDD